MTTIVARPNNMMLKTRCALCGLEDREDEVDLYLAGTLYDWVCLGCARQHASDLADAVERLRDEAIATWDQVGYLPDGYYHQAGLYDPIPLEHLRWLAERFVAWRSYRVPDRPTLRLIDGGGR